MNIFTKQLTLLLAFTASALSITSMEEDTFKRTQRALLYSTGFVAICSPLVYAANRGVVGVRNAFKSVPHETGFETVESLKIAAMKRRTLNHREALQATAIQVPFYIAFYAYRAYKEKIVE